MPDLSVLIPARNEMFLNHTIQDVLAHAEMDTDIIVVLDGAWPVEPVPDNPRVTLIHLSESIGQRAACNLAARVSQARYVMKLDAHCSVGQGFDRIMLEDMQPGWTMVPTMYNLHAFDWVCRECGARRYQGPSGPCKQCGGETVRDVLWRAKRNPETTAMRFDRALKFQYWSGYKKRQSGDLVDTMSILGACFLATRERWFALPLCDEAHGGWGQQGTEVACATWLSGGRLVVNRRTWFAHLFRTQGGDFGFPYRITGSDVRAARNYSQELWRADKPDQMPDFPSAIHPLSWLIQRFAPVPEWDLSEHPITTLVRLGRLQSISSSPSLEAVPSIVDDPTKAILYYTDNRLDPAIMAACQEQIKASGLPVVCVSLKPVEGFAHNVVVDAERGPLTLHRQILAGLEATDADVVYFAEHDVLYHPSHWEFTPPSADQFYYNTNVWKVRAEDGHALWTDDLQQTSGLCAYRNLLLAHYRRRVAEIERGGFDRHYEPGEKTGGRSANWQSEWPNLDIRHRRNLTRNRWLRSQYRNKRYTRGWTEADAVPPWYGVGEFGELLT